MRSLLFPCLIAAANVACVEPPPSTQPVGASTDFGHFDAILPDVQPTGTDMSGDLTVAVDAAPDVADSGTPDATRDVSSPDADVLPDMPSDTGPDGPMRLPVTVPAGMVTDDLANFPLLVDFESSELAALAVRGNQIGFEDETGTPLPTDIEGYNAAAGRVRAWVLVPELSSTAATTIYMVFDDPPTAARDVWADYSAVWHFQSGMSGTYMDRTVHGHLAEPVGGPQSADGKIGRAVRLDGIGAFYEVASTAELEPANLSITLWMNTADKGALVTPISKPYGPGSGNSYQFWLSAEMGLRGYVLTDVSAYNDGAGTVPANVWTHLAFTWDGTTKVLYIDGVETHRVTTMGSAIYDGKAMLIGADKNSGSPLYFVDGRIDELRIAPTALPAARIAAERRNQDDPGNFVTVGTLEQL